jgi:hypothetical protein
MLFGGLWTLFVQDRARRWMSWAVLIALILAWVGYYEWNRIPTTRVVLEVLSVGAWLVGMWRVYRLMRYEHVVPPFTPTLSKLYELVKPIVLNPWVFGVKAWILFMIIADITGLTNFSWLAYTAVSMLLVAVGMWVGMRIPARAK